MTVDRRETKELEQAVGLDLTHKDGIVVDLTTGGTLSLTQPVVPVPFVDLASTLGRSKDLILEAIAEVVDRGDFILGAAVAEFEELFAAYCGVPHAVGVNSGYSALELILRGMGIGQGSEVITAANTFIATINAVHHVGATPVLVDMDPETYNIDASLIEAAITPRTEAIIAVHLYGRPADMDALRRIADRHGLALIEDAAQAHGAIYRSRRTGGLGDAAAFSFYPSKNLGAFGDAGTVVTGDAELAARIRILGNVGQTEKYHHDVPGFNRRLDTIQAAVLKKRLESLDEENRWRRRVADRYRALLDGTPVRTPSAPDQTGDSDHVYHLYVIQTEERTDLAAHLRKREIATGIHYPIPAHLQPAFSHLRYRRGAFPATEQAAERILSLPMYPGLEVEAVNRVAAAVRDFYGR